MLEKESVVRSVGVVWLLAGFAGASGHATHAIAQVAQKLCTSGTDSAGADVDLYCIKLLPAEGIDAAPGTARILAPSSPFGVAVAPAGEPAYDVLFDVQGLPSPSTLGPYRAYVAWATTPQMHPLVKLGEIGNGRVTLGRIRFDRTLILITAETSAAVTDRTGRLVLRGTSAAVRMQPHDLAFLLAGLLDKADAPAVDHSQHALGGPGQWSPPPMHPQVTMPPALMTLRPDVAPYAPVTDAAIPLARPRRLLGLRRGD